jgi:hypothetical protein
MSGMFANARAEYQKIIINKYKPVEGIANFILGWACKKRHLVGVVVFVQSPVHMA